MPGGDLERLRARLVACVSAAETVPTAGFPLPEADGSWTDIDYADAGRTTWKPRVHLARTRKLAMDTMAGTFPPEPVLSALNHWIRKDPQSLNWWHNQIGAPRLLGESLLLLGRHLPDELLTSAMPALDRADDSRLIEPSGARPMSWTGANLLWISANRLISGALLGDLGRIEKSIAAAFGEIRLADPGHEGIQEDGSFHQHGPLLYNGGYGCAFLAECSFFLQVAHGTRWQASPEIREVIARFVLDGTRWMLRGKNLNPGCRDREITRPQASETALVPIVRFLAGFSPKRTAELSDLAAALETGRAPGQLAGNRMFYRSDFMVKQSPRASLSVRMCSRRTVRAECVNGEGLLSHHLSDGLTYLAAKGDEYRNIFPVWDWQKLPGITCLQRSAPEAPGLVARRGGSDLVGGVSDGSFGACTLEIAYDQLAARKSWFFGPAGMMCLGAGIAGFAPGAVVTTLDQSLLQGPVFHCRTDTALTSGSHALHSVRWLSHGNWGFVFPEPASVNVFVGPKSGSWARIGSGSSEPVTLDVFQATIDHGENVAAASYAYLVAPGTSPEELAVHSMSPSFRIVANTPAVRAVWWPDARLFQATFSDPGSVAWTDDRIIGVDRPCCIQLRMDEHGAGTLAVAELRQAGETVTVECRDRTGAPKNRAVLPMPAGTRAGATVIAAW